MQKLQEWRAGKLLSIRALAEKAEVSTKTIVQLEAGRQLPVFKTMQKISDALGVPASEITEFSEAVAERGKDAA